jgi:hypothetical protein
MHSLLGAPATVNQKQMISNERPSPFYRQPNRNPYPGPLYGHQQQPRPQVQEETLKTCNLEVERKAFRLTLKDNARGRFLRVTETSGNKFNSIVIPAPGLADFQRMLNEMLGALDEPPASLDSAPMPSPAEDPAPPPAQVEPSPTPEPAATAPAPVPASAAPAPAPVLRPAKKAKPAKSKAASAGKVGRKKKKAADEAIL